MNFDEIILFNGKSYADLLKNIYDNSLDKSKQINSFLTQLKDLIKSSNDAAILIPMVKEYLDVSVRNDEQLVKMAGVVQRFFSGRAAEVGEGNYLITDAEKEELLKNVKQIAEGGVKDEAIIKLGNKINENINP